AAEHVVSDGQLTVSKIFPDALVDSFIASANQDDTLQPRKFFCRGLVEAFTLRREQHHALLVSPGNTIFPRTYFERYQTFKDRFRLEHHALAAAKWAVIHSAVPVMCKGPQIVDLKLYKS